MNLNDKVFLINGMDQHGEITRVGRITAFVDKWYVDIDRAGPYNRGMVFLDTAENRERFSTFVQACKVRASQEGREMYETLNLMRTSP